MPLDTKTQSDITVVCGWGLQSFLCWSGTQKGREGECELAHARAGRFFTYSMFILTQQSFAGNSGHNISSQVWACARKRQRVEQLFTRYGFTFLDYDTCSHVRFSFLWKEGSMYMSTKRCQVICRYCTAVGGLHCYHPAECEPDSPVGHRGWFGVRFHFSTVHSACRRPCAGTSLSNIADNWHEWGPFRPSSCWCGTRCKQSFHLDYLDGGLCCGSVGRQGEHSEPA